MQNIKERQEFENYNKIKLLGEGSFGKAFLVERASDKVRGIISLISGLVEMRDEADRYQQDE
jgi:serine/threonine protein kinase